MSRRKQSNDRDQLQLAFNATINERLAQIRSLERVLQMHPDRARGVMDLLERIAMSSSDGETSHARVSAIAARIHSKKAVNERTIRRWRDDAVELGVLVVDFVSARYGGRSPNRWTIQVPRLLALLQGEAGAGAGRTWGGRGADTMPAPRADTMPALTEVGTVCRDEDSGTGTGRPDTGAGFGYSSEPGSFHTDQRYGDAVEPGLAVSARNTLWEPPDQDSLRRMLVENHPLLRAASQRLVARLPPGTLVGNVFAPLTQRDLCSAALIRWFRMQLGVPDPVTVDTEADLLLVMAIGFWAGEVMPAREIRKTRVALFVHTITRRKWRSGCGQLARARGQLDAYLAHFPQALRDPNGMGVRVDAVQSSEVSV